MRTQIPSTPRLGGALPAAYAAEIDSFLRSLEAENLAPKTRRGYDCDDLAPLCAIRVLPPIDHDLDRLVVAVVGRFCCSHDSGPLVTL